MPVPKRWHPVSHDLFADEGIWDAVEKFGDRVVFLWLEILSILDRHDNQFKVVDNTISNLARRVRQRPASVQLALSYWLASGWIELNKELTTPQQTVYSSPKYWKYHRTREILGSQKGDIKAVLSYPILSETKEKERIPLTPLRIQPVDKSQDKNSKPKPLHCVCCSKETFIADQDHDGLFPVCTLHVGRVNRTGHDLYATENS